MILDLHDATSLRRPKNVCINDINWSRCYNDIDAAALLHPMQVQYLWDLELWDTISINF